MVKNLYSSFFFVFTLLGLFIHALAQKEFHAGENINEIEKQDALKRFQMERVGMGKTNVRPVSEIIIPSLYIGTEAYLNQGTKQPKRSKQFAIPPSKASNLFFISDTSLATGFTPYASLLADATLYVTFFIDPLFKHGGLGKLTTVQDNLFGSFPNPLLNIGGIGIAVAYENRIAYLLGLNAFVRLNQDYFFGNHDYYNQSVWNESRQIVYGNVGVLLKRYYNEYKRYQKHKNIQHNASNYYGISLETLTPQILTTGDLGIELNHWSLIMSLHYGLQRTLGKSCLFGIDWSLGAFYQQDIFSPSLSMSCGFSYVKEIGKKAAR